MEIEYISATLDEHHQRYMRRSNLAEEWENAAKGGLLLTGMLVGTALLSPYVSHVLSSGADSVGMHLFKSVFDELSIRTSFLWTSALNTGIISMNTYTASHRLRDNEIKFKGKFTSFMSPLSKCFGAACLALATTEITSRVVFQQSLLNIAPDLMNIFSFTVAGAQMTVTGFALEAGYEDPKVQEEEYC